MTFIDVNDGLEKTAIGGFTLHVIKGARPETLPPPENSSLPVEESFDGPILESEPAPTPPEDQIEVAVNGVSSDGVIDLSFSEPLGANA